MALRYRMTGGPEPRARGRLAINLGLAALSTALVLALLELGARWLGLTTPFFLLASEATCIQRSSLLSMEFRPNCVGSLGATAFRTNALGLRGGPVRDDGSVRILVIGDSCTWGWNVREEEAYPSALQQLLDQRLGRDRFQVVNAGFPGNTSYQGLLYLRERGLALGPAIVVAAFGFNDLTPGGDIAEQLARERYTMPFLRLDDFLLDRSRMYRWARWATARNGTKDQTVRATPEKYRRNMAAIAELARQRGARVMFVSFHHPSEPHREYHNALADAGWDLHVPIVWYDGPRLDPVHPTAAGYRVLAADLLDRMEREGFLADPAAESR